MLAEERQASENELAPSEGDDTESTVIITTTESTVPVAFELAEQQARYCEATQPSHKLRSGMMRESLEQSAAGNDHIQETAMRSEERRVGKEC